MMLSNKAGDLAPLDGPQRREMFPPMSNLADDDNAVVVEVSNVQFSPLKSAVKEAEERDAAEVARSLAAVSRLIQRVTDALEGGTPYLGTNDQAVLFGELSSLRREKALLREKDLRLQERTNLLLTTTRTARGEDGSSSTCNGEQPSATESEAEDERILQRVDSFSILIVVSTLITGFSIPTIEQAQLGITRSIMTLVFALEMFATIFFSIISFYAKQAFNYGSTNNHRTARFMYHVRWITFSSQACYTIGILLFVVGILLEATIGYDTYWALAGVGPVVILSVVCWLSAANALISLRMGLWTNSLLLFDAESKLVGQKRATFIPAPASFREWFGQNDDSSSQP
ncbi:unnamed protein product [Ectocarpus sp. 12 AP-2014]